jgi:hypothetical protein
VRRDQRRGYSNQIAFDGSPVDRNHPAWGGACKPLSKP